MKTSRKLLSLLLIMLLIFSMMPSQAVAAAAEEAVSSAAETEQQAVSEQAGEVKEETDDTSPGKGSEESVEQPEKGAESQSAPEQGQNKRSSGGQQKASPSNSDDEKSENSAGKKKQSAVVPRSSLQLQADELPSGTVSGDWIWKVTGEEGNYTLTFEYTGTAATPPTFAVPANFVANISTQLGDLQSQIKKVVVPEGCTAINTRAFQNLKGLEEVEIGSTVQTIGTVAFGDNNSSNAGIRDTKLKKVTFKTGSNGKSSLQKIEAGAFTGCSALSSVNLEDTQLQFIGYEAFRSCALEEVNIPDSIAKSTTSYNSSNSNYQIAGYAFADNSKLKSVSMPAFFYIPYSAGGYIFSNCTALEDVVFREVEGAIVRNYYSSALPDAIFRGDTNLKVVDLSAWTESTRATTFSLSYGLFESSATNSTVKLTNLEKIILPEKDITIGNNTFYNKTGIKNWDQLENHEYITSIGDRAFYGTRLESCDMSNMTKLTTIGMEAFKNCEDMTKLVIPENVTTIGSAAFKNCDNLETVRIEAKQLTSVSNSNLFHGDDNLKTVTISDKTKKINGNVLAAIPADADTFFEGENVIEITKATAKGGAKPLKDLNGTFYVDPQGVLYKLSDDGKASLAYVPPGIETYTVPETITTPDGTEYTVNGINAYALSLADDLTAITFAKPENIYLKSSAFTGWSTATDNMGKTVNGEESITDVDAWRKVSNLCDFPIGNVEGELVQTIQDTYINSDGKQTLKVVVAVNDKQPEEDKTYDYLTGQIATYTIAISNDDNVTLDKVVRIYFSYSEDGYKMGSFYEGDYNIKNPSTGTIYPMKVVQTDNPNVYYYEITGILPGETLAFTNDIHYPVKETGGGEVKIWTHTISKELAQETEGQVINPKDYMELDWLTSPIVFDYNKTNTTYYDTTVSKGRTPIIMTNSDGEAYVTALAYRLKETNQSGSSSKTEGLDFIRWVNYHDEITLPEELYWRPEVIEALQAGKWSVEDVSSQYSDNGTNTMTQKAITVNANGKKYYLAYLGKRGGYDYTYIDNLKVKVGDDGKTLRLTWKVSNTSLSGASATNEYAAQDFYLRFGDGVIMADLDKVNELLDNNPDKTLLELLKIHNETDEIRHYSYSPNQTAESSADNPVDANYDVLINKKFQQLDDSNRPNRNGGTDEFFNITINNTGILNLTDWGAASVVDGVKKYDGHLIEDTINRYLFIEPQNIEKMLNQVVSLGTGANAQNVNIGDWLTITITKGSLYNNNDGDPNEYPVVDGTDQNNKYTANSNSNISHANDNGLRVNEGAKFVITKNTDGQIIVTLSGDTTAENNKTYTIGAGGDYSSIKALFTAIGYMPTSNTIYKADYKLRPNEQFILKPGQKLVVPILTTIKTTPMLLTSDSESYYPSVYMSLDNSATVRLRVGKEDRNKTYKTKYVHDWYRELYLYKYGYMNNSQITSNSTSVKDGTVIDSTLYAYNTSGKAYDHMNMSDYMIGAQVALAPVAQNPGLTAPDGSELDTYTADGISYYLLNKPGTYTNVTFGRKTSTNSASERKGTQNWKADITVTETVSNNKRTSLNTKIIWKPFKNWGGTSTATYMHYRSLVSAEKAGLAGADNPGEVEQYELNNKAWLGDHQGHRLYDYMGFYTQIYSFSKYIVSKNGHGDGTDSTSDGTLVKFSRLRQSDTATYQITINNTSTAPTVLNGSRIYDNLPNNKGKFTWEKGVNVKNLRFIGSDGVEIKYGSGTDAVSIPTDGTVDDHWRIDTTSTAGLQQIRWDDNFNIHFPVSGNVKILIDLTFPARTEGVSVWDQYVAEYAGKQLTNTFYLDRRYDSVNHLLESEGKAVLYKGVYDNGLTTKGGSEYSYRGTYTSNNTRLMYQNGTGSNSISDPDLKASTITYYTILYNGSYDRLYLSDIEDELPRGFTYNSMCYTSATNTRIDNNSSTYTGYIGYRTSSYNSSVTTESRGSTSEKLVTIDKSADPYDNNTVTYKAAYIAPSVRTVNGRQHITFKVTGVGYDSEVGKNYLNPGEAVRFGYNVLIDQYAKTDDEATNTITMPYYDYYNTGFTLDAPDEEGNGGAIQKARAVTGITPNDGGCELMTKDEVAEKFGMNTSQYTDDAYNSNEKGNFMVSSVTVHRAGITPGLQKTIGGLTEKANNPTSTTVEGPSSGYGTKYKGGAKTSDVVNWKLRLYNEAPGRNDEAGGMMTDYTIVDTVDTPFSFTGRVYYDMYRNTSANGTKVTHSTQYLFTLGTRTIAESESGRDTKVRISSGDTLTASGNRDLNIGSAEDDSDDDWFSFGSGAKSGKVKIERDAKGKEIMTIKMTGPGYSIPAGHWMDLCVHTMYTLDEVIISEPKYNDAILYPEQGYDPDSVVQGRARTKQEYDESGQLITKNDGIQSGASIMLNQGYTTSSWKQITEIDDPSNTARSDESSNYIVLSDKTKNVKYDLYVVGPTTSISKMVVIDDLPHQGDHSAFVEDDERHSEFSVGFLESDLGLTVTMAQKTGESGGVNTYGAETVVDESQYEVYVTTKTTFDRATDWIGTGEGWTRIDDLEGDELKEVLKSARSIRVIVKDPNAWQMDSSLYQMYKEFRLHIAFNARINDNNAEPGQIAWNSFGYKYQVPLTRNDTEEDSASIYLEAQPLNVGLKYPNAPILTKKLSEEVTETVQKIDENGNPVFKPVLDENGNPKQQPVLDENGEPMQQQVFDGEGNPVLDVNGDPVYEPVMEDVVEPDTEEVTKIVDHKAEQDLDFKFIIYEGDPIEDLNDVSDMTEDQIAANLVTQGRKFVYLPYTVKKGESSYELGLWTIDYCSKYDPESEAFIDDEDNLWAWISGKKYTLLELDMGQYNYEYLKISIDGEEHSNNNRWFVNNTDTKIRLTVDNRYQPEYVDVSGTKTWVDNDDKAGKRPEKITVNLFANGEKVDSKDFTPDEDGNWTYKFGHLLKEKEDGTHISYSVTEDAVRYYDTEISDPETDENGNVTSNITNTLNYVEINVEKKWDDRDDIAKIRPDEIKVHLLSAEWKQKLDDQGEPVLDDNGKPVYEAPAEEDFKEIDSAVIKEDEDGNWSKLFKDLPDHNKDGVKIEYRVTEDEVDYYDTTIDQETDSAGIVTTFTVTNTLNYMEVTGTKVWDDRDNAAGLRPGQITVRLMRNQFDENGKEIVDENGKPVLIPATRQIMDENGEPVLDENGKPTYEEITAKLPDAQGSWEFRFDQLMMADDKGNMINYVVEEDRVPHYKEPVVEPVTKYVVDENGEYVLDDEGNKIEDQINKEFRITNSIELTEVSVEKYWDDYNDSAGLRPGEITVELLADGKVADTVKVTAEQDWKHTFANLPKVDANWNEIKYTVSEQPVADYETGISPAGDGKFTITNRCLYIDLLLTKKMPERFGAGSGKNSTIAFRVEGKDKDGNIVYQNTVGFAFNEESGASETKVLKKVPIDAEYTVTEIYSGSYTPKQAKITKKEVEQYDGEYRGYRGRTVWLFEFENDIGESGTGDNGGIVNNYSDNGSGVRFEGGEE